MDVSEAKQLVYEAILNCRVFISNFYNGDAKGFVFLAENSSGSAQVGGELTYEKGTQITVKLPASAQVRLIKNGILVNKDEGKQITFEVDEPGLFRVEIFRDKRAWIYSNHIRILGANKEMAE
jgi:hypothetical protein